MHTWYLWWSTCVRDPRKLTRELPSGRQNRNLSSTAAAQRKPATLDLLPLRLNDLIWLVAHADTVVPRCVLVWTHQWSIPEEPVAFNILSASPNLFTNSMKSCRHGDMKTSSSGHNHWVGFMSWDTAVSQNICLLVKHRQTGVFTVFQYNFGGLVVSLNVSTFCSIPLVDVSSTFYSTTFIWYLQLLVTFHIACCIRAKLVYFWSAVIAFFWLQSVSPTLWLSSSSLLSFRSSASMLHARKHKVREVKHCRIRQHWCW